MGVGVGYAIEWKCPVEVNSELPVIDEPGRLAQAVPVGFDQGFRRDADTGCGGEIGEAIRSARGDSNEESSGSEHAK